MLYNSFDFIFVFLPICLALYFLSAKLSLRLANVVLTLMSFGFYGYWDWTHPAQHGPPLGNMMVLVASILLNYTIGALVRKHRHVGLLATGITINLLVLGYFKYTNFLLFNINAILDGSIPLWQIALPLGISFFTFTQIAFLVDAHRGLAKEMDFFRYCLFVTFFPHLIAGPIVHHSQIMPQFADPGAKRWNPHNVNIGIAFFCLGLAKKVLIADAVAPWANAVFSAGGPVASADAWLGSLSYAMQLYFDFSGYSDMAIGLAMLFNVRMPDNFDAPYRAAGIVDFWRRWHITLSNFLRDYLYIPLGGNRKGPTRRRINLLLTMLLGGIWHGAGWTFAIWGAWHGILLTINHLWSQNHRPMPAWLSRPVTFLAVLVGWVFFRANSTPDAVHLLGRMFIPVGDAARSAAILDWRYAAPVLAVLLVFVNVMPTTKRWIESKPLGLARAVGLGILFFICLLMMRNAFLTNTPSQFIYFQF